MENLHNNKKTAEVFSRYTEQRFGWKYQVILPTTTNDPNFDARLDSRGHETLFLQLKQSIIGEYSENILTKSKSKGFSFLSFESVVEKAQDKYKDRAKNLILVLHVDEGYLIPSDGERTNKNNFIGSIFRGIYIVSPERELFKAGSGKEIQDEFVFELKSAFE